MIRISALLALAMLLLAQNPAHAGDFPGSPDCKEGEDCNPPEQPVPPPSQPSEPAPGPEVGFCSGTFEGYYANDPAPVTFQIDQNGQWGELKVTAWWRGGMWYGQGFCREVNACEAAVEIYFPGAPVHRGVIRQSGGEAQLDGRIDYGNFFRLQRTN